MSSPCARGATASGGVTFMRAASSLIPSTCFIACLLFAWTNFHVSFAIAAPTHANEKARCVALAHMPARATSVMMDVLIDEQELPEPVRLRAICVYIKNLLDS